MKKWYSQMTKPELEEEMKQLRQAMEEAEFPSQRAVLEQKYWTAKAYLVKDGHYPPGVYHVEGRQLPFELVYVNGIMAWGKLGDDAEASFPLSMLTPL